ncbi:hypothetical protein [Streptomyces sp. RFCAC02]|uniref:hypothetical protein n=1 Tax=Streptomyces sp. RFCAC02 TaxID=2499143 RepID=UPI00101EB09F|nr:hypothetical protein [Streptomyces sp. RFCAC02]
MVSDTVLVGLLTFLGTGLATAAGVWQWQRAHAREARADFRAERVKALGEVWEALSDLEETQRTSVTRRGQAAGTGELTRVNLLLLRRSPFLRPDEQEWAQAFAHHVTVIDTLIRAEAEGGRPAAQWWITSAQQPASSGIAAVAAQQLRSLRVKLGERYAAVVRGDSD